MKALLIVSALALSLSGCVGYIHDGGYHRDGGDRHDGGHYDPGPRHGDSRYDRDRQRDNRYYCPPDRNC